MHTLRRLFLLASIAFLSATTVTATNQGKTIIILDGSGSMWGEVPGGIKIDIAKKAISDLVSTLDPGVELGLMAYGHRKKGDCSDIEILVSPGAGAKNRKAIADAVARIAPKGKTPLCDAVLMAATSLKFEEAKSTVILVSDGIETCGKDPCVVGDQLAVMGVDFVCHVVAFDLLREKNAGLDCLSSKTGGLYLEAKGADSLLNSLNKAVETVSAPQTTLVLSGRSAEGELLSGVEFQINQDDKQVVKGAGGKFRTPVKPGTYQITGSFGELKASAEVTAEEGKTNNHELVFQATGITARASLSKDGEPIEKNLGWKLYDKPASDPDREAIGYSYRSQPTFHVSVGTYFLHASHKESSAEISVEVTAEKKADVTLVFGSGTIVAQARMGENDDPITKNMSWKLFSAEPDAEGDHRKVAFSYKAHAQIVVPTGRYLLRASHGQAATQQEVEVKAGETTSAMLTFGAGTIIAQATMSEGGEVATRDIGWKLLSSPDQEGNRKSVGSSYKSKSTFKVPSGDYLLQLKRGSASTEQEVVVSSGEVIDVTLNLNAGTWQGEAVMIEGGEVVTKDTKWEIHTLPDEEGKTTKLAFGYGKTSKFHLPAGTHTARLKRGRGFTSKEITISPGKFSKDQLNLNCGIAQITSTIPSTSKLEIFGSSEGEIDLKQKFGFAFKKELKAYLPEGKYFARSKEPEKQFTTAEFEITAGKIENVEIGKQ